MVRSDVGRAAVVDSRIDAALAVIGRRGVPGGSSDGWELRQLAGGWSRHTFLLSRSPAEHYVIRVKPPGALLDSDLEREFSTYQELRRARVRVPRVHGVDPSDATPFGGPFFVMDWVPGEAPVVWRRPELDRLEANWSSSGSLGEDLVKTLTEIHSAPADRFGFLGPARTFQDIVRHWQDTYDRQRLVRDPVVEEAFAWVLSRPPSPAEPGLVHGDYRIGNTMVQDGHITAVIDWELAYLGDRRYDLGYVMLEYLAGKFVRPGSSLVCGVAEAEWFLAEYERLTGESLDREVLRTYGVLGLLALTAILHTGIRMYAEGKTRDVRMAWNRFALPGLRQDLVRMMDW